MPNRMRIAFAALLSISLLSPVLVHAEDAGQEDPDAKELGQDWKLIKEDRTRNIKVFLRKDSNYRLTVNRMQAVFEAPLSSIVAACMDVDNMVHWIWRLRSAEQLKKGAPNDQYLYFVINGPYGVDDRDAVIRTHIAQDPQTKAVTLTTKTEDNFLPEKPPLVRMAKLEMNWKFTPRPDGSVDAEMVGVIDPGGKIPAWTANMVQRSALYSSLKSLMRLVKQDKYRNPSLPITIVD